MSRTVSKPESQPSSKLRLEPPTEKPKETLRDFLEQIVVAILLAMLIRGFDAEAFVIPTGSMAPTLMGRHKEVICPQCGFTYSINASEEIDRFIVNKQFAAKESLEEAKLAPERLVAAERNLQSAQRSGNVELVQSATEMVNELKVVVANADRKIETAEAVIQDCHESGICVNCRFRLDNLDDSPSFKGDRILVMKFPYELPMLPNSGGPRRWDVVVFHRPEGPETNYIKRLVGMPGETLRILYGDILARPSNVDTPFVLQRKPLIHQQAMQILVHDDNFRPSAFADKPEWRRWKPAGAIKETDGSKFVVASKSDSEWSDLRYRHLLPDPEQWAAVLAKAPVIKSPRPTLITDFYSYNTNISPYENKWYDKANGWIQPNWMGDLTLSCRVELEATQAGGMARFELIEAGVSNRCEVDLISGVASIYHGEKKLGESNTLLKGTGTHDVGFANVDNRLTFWVDGLPIFQDGLTYDDGAEEPHIPTVKDLEPAGVSFKASSATVSDLVLKRDIYYTQTARNADLTAPGTDEYVDFKTRNENQAVNRLFDFLSDPSKFGEFKQLGGRDFEIHPDHFLMLGDNSPHSSDSREWGSDDRDWRKPLERENWEVPRSLLIGKAFFIYWPHGKPFGPDIRYSRDIRLPFRPYFERMRWIR